MTDSKDNYRTGKHTVFRLHAHVVLMTKYRRHAISDRVRELLVETTREACRRNDTVLLEADGESDHLHLLIDYPPNIALARLVGTIKTNTSRRVRQQGWPEVTRTLWGEHFWSPSYFVTSTGGAPLELVAAYVRSQREQNRKTR